MKNMLLHAREQAGEPEPTDLNALVDESLKLAYHGERARNASFNITMESNYDDALGMVKVMPQELTRVLVNLFSNSFYATLKRQEMGGDYDPKVAVSTRVVDDQAEIRIRDNGTGMSKDVAEKIFNPFFTTKPAGEGTGLGLSLSYDIVVQQHAGSMRVKSEEGVFTEFIIGLPTEDDEGTAT
jgi:signal transduction histidine kinase